MILYVMIFFWFEVYIVKVLRMYLLEKILAFPLHRYTAHILHFSRKTNIHVRSYIKAADGLRQRVKQINFRFKSIIYLYALCTQVSLNMSFTLKFKNKTKKASLRDTFWNIDTYICCCCFRVSVEYYITTLMLSCY